MTVRAIIFHIQFAIIGAVTMNSTQALNPQSAPPMQGPDFVLSKVVALNEADNAESRLVLRDGSHWKLARNVASYAPMRDYITHAMQIDGYLFVSGNKASGAIDRVVEPRRLAVQQIGGPTHGQYAIQFWGPPSIYHIDTGRPWFDAAMALLRQSASGKAFMDSPDLLVAIDTVTSEIMDVRSLESLGER